MHVTQGQVWRSLHVQSRRNLACDSGVKLGRSTGDFVYALRWHGFTKVVQ